MCKAHTLGGLRCKNSAMLGTDKCWVHADTCSICLDKVGVGDDTSRLECGHSYHSSCIYKWLERDSRCPMCRKDTRERVNMTLYYDNEEDIEPEGEILERMRQLNQAGLVGDEVWIRRGLIFYNADGELVAAFDRH